MDIKREAQDVIKAIISIQGKVESGYINLLDGLSKEDSDTLNDTIAVLYRIASACQ